MHTLEDLKEMLCDELEKIGRQKDLSAGDLETLHKLTATIKNIDKILMFDEYDGGYSRDGYDRGDMMNRGDSYRGRSSYRGESYARQRRNARGQYSRGDMTEHFISKLEEMEAQTTNSTERAALRQCIDKLEGM